MNFALQPGDMIGGFCDTTPTWVYVGTDQWLIIAEPTNVNYGRFTCVPTPQHDVDEKYKVWRNRELVWPEERRDVKPVVREAIAAPNGLANVESVIERVALSNEFRPGDKVRVTVELVNE